MPNKESFKPLEAIGKRPEEMQYEEGLRVMESRTERRGRVFKRKEVGIHKLVDSEGFTIGTEEIERLKEGTDRMIRKDNNGRIISIKEYDTDKEGNPLAVRQIDVETGKVTGSIERMPNTIWKTTYGKKFGEELRREGYNLEGVRTSSKETQHEYFQGRLCGITSEKEEFYDKTSNVKKTKTTEYKYYDRDGQQKESQLTETTENTVPDRYSSFYQSFDRNGLTKTRFSRELVGQKTEKSVLEQQGFKPTISDHLEVEIYPKKGAVRGQPESIVVSDNSRDITEVSKDRKYDKKGRLMSETVYNPSEEIDRKMVHTYSDDRDLIGSRSEVEKFRVDLSATDEWRKAASDRKNER